MSAKVSNIASKAEADEIVSIWLSHIPVDSYGMIEDDVAIFKINWFSVWEVKDYLLKQKRCLWVHFGGKTYPDDHDEL